MAVGDELVLETTHLRVTVDADGFATGLYDRATGEQYCDLSRPRPFMTATVDGVCYPPTGLSRVAGCIRADFGRIGVQAVVEVENREDYLVFTVAELSGPNVEALDFINLLPSITEHIGPWLNIAWNDTFGVCAIALNNQTHCQTELQEGWRLQARCYDRFGLMGARAALIGGPPSEIRAIIERVELREGLAHPVLGGTWAKDSEEAKRSYLFVDLTEGNVDQVIDYAAAAGRRQVLTYVSTWSSGAGHYPVNPDNYPEGGASLKRVADKLHNAGMKIGIHINTPVVWKTDAYVSPVPDPRLVKNDPLILAEDICAESSDVPVMSQPILMKPIYLYDYTNLMATWNGIASRRPLTRPVVAGYAQKGDVTFDVQIGDEIVECTETGTLSLRATARGARETQAASHRAGTRIYPLYEFGGAYVYDADTDICEEIGARLAEVTNTCGIDMIYCDSSGRLQGPSWHYRTRTQMAIFERVERELLMFGSDYSNSTWHAFARYTVADLGRAYRHRHTDQVRVARSRIARDNLMPVDFGWYGILAGEVPTVPEELDYPFERAQEFDACIGIQTRVAELEANPQTPEILARFREHEMERFGEEPG